MWVNAAVADLNELMHRTVQSPDWTTVLVAGLLGGAVVGSTALPRVTRLRMAAYGINIIGTIVHEAGHAVAALISGGGVYRIELHSPNSGATASWYRSYPSLVITTLAGYAAPPLAGLGLAALLAHGRLPLALLMLTAAMALILLVCRDLYTLTAVLAVGVVNAATLWWAPVWLQHGVTYTTAWVLLLTNLPNLAGLVLHLARSLGEDVDEGQGVDDATALAIYTRVPALVWTAVWVTLTGWSLWHAMPLLW